MTASSSTGLRYVGVVHGESEIIGSGIGDRSPAAVKLKGLES
jgi:hypothetical protein